MNTQKIPTYEALALQLKHLKVDCVFGLMSDETAQFLASVDAVGIRFLRARHENNAMSMADGYATSSGKLGVVVLGRGPATANGLHGIMYVRKAGSRVLLMLGSPSIAPANPNAFGPDYKAMDQITVLRGVGVKHMTLDDPEIAPALLTRAASDAHQGLVALLLPINVLGASTPSSSLIDAPLPSSAPFCPQPRPTALRAAAAALQLSRKPLIVAGAGAHYSGARDAIVHLADHLGAALATSMKAKDLFKGHPFNCGVIGSFSNSAGRRLTDTADCVLTFGAGLNQRTTSHGTSLPAAATFIQVDASRNAIGQWLHCDVGIVSDARVAAEQLVALIPAPAEHAMRSVANRGVLADYRPEQEFEARHTPRTIDPRTAAIELDRMLPQDRNVVYDGGNFLLVAPYISVPGPAHVKQTSDFSSIGMGFGAALGFAIGDPGRTTVLIIGDGGFMMTLSELETTAREGIPLVIVVLNDCAYGAELHHLKLRDGPVATTIFPDIDFAPVAETFGLQAVTVRTLNELRALAPLLAAPDGPLLIDCKISSSVAAAFLEEIAPKKK